MSGLVVVCDGQNVDVFDYTYSPDRTVSDPQKISTSYRAPTFNEYGVINLPHRLAYGQDNYAAFRDRLRNENMLNIHDIPAGGAGNQFLRTEQDLCARVLSLAGLVVLLLKRRQRLEQHVIGGVDHEIVDAVTDGARFGLVVKLSRFKMFLS
jgi:hypothetical protein